MAGETSDSAMIARHDEDIRELRRDVGSIYTEIKSQNAALAAIANSITEMKAQRGPGFLSMLDVASRIVTLVGAVVVGVVYLATNGQSPAQHAIDKRVTILESQAVQSAEDRKAILELSKQAAVQEYRLKRGEEDQKALRSSFGWRATVTQN